MQIDGRSKVKDAVSFFLNTNDGRTVLWFGSDHDEMPCPHVSTTLPSLALVRSSTPQSSLTAPFPVEFRVLGLSSAWCSMGNESVQGQLTFSKVFWRGEDGHRRDSQKSEISL